MDAKIAEKIQRNPLLSRIATIEQELFQRIVDLACLQNETVNRWVAYELLKNMAKRIAGFTAAYEELRTCQHYEAMVDLVDCLLPEDIGCGDPIGFTPDDLREAPAWAYVMMQAVPVEEEDWA